MFEVMLGHFARPSASVAANLADLEPQSLSFFLVFSFVHRQQDSIRSTYSFVHMLLAMLGAVDYRDYTISSGAGGPHTKRSLCYRSMDHRV